MSNPSSIPPTANNSQPSIPAANADKKTNNIQIPQEAEPITRSPWKNILSIIFLIAFFAAALAGGYFLKQYLLSQ